MLIMVCGLPGTGKTTLCREILKRLKAHLIRTDVIRKAIFEKPEYTEEEKEFVYEQVLDLTGIYLAKGENVILDATFHSKGTRKRFYSVADRLKVPLEIIEVVCPPGKVRSNMSERSGKDKSDAGPGVYELVKKQWEPIERDHVIIDSSKKGWREEVGKLF